MVVGVTVRFARRFKPRRGRLFIDEPRLNPTSNPVGVTGDRQSSSRVAAPISKSPRTRFGKISEPRFCYQQATTGFKPDARGFEAHPGGMFENSPTFQRWVGAVQGLQVPKGRPSSGTVSAVPSELIGVQSWFPTLKRWANVGCPFGTRTWPRGSAANPFRLLPSCPRSGCVA
jgi:hypothetical protein